MRPILPLLALLLLLSAAPAAAAHARFEPGNATAKDFAIVKRDGVYHLFYIRHQNDVPRALNEVDFGHAISKDLYSWTELAPVLAVRDSSWDRTHVWAPSIVQKDGVYYLYYTGVTDLWQRIGLATSTDLLTWTRRDAPVFSCLQTPWAFCDSTTENTAFRDPFVMPDPAVPGSWRMIYSALPTADLGSMVVGTATSTDLAHWTDAGPLWAAFRDRTGMRIVESPHVFAHAGLWYLFFTSESTTSPLQWMTGPDPAGAAETWAFRGGVAGLFPVGDPIYFDYASEQFQDGLVDYFACVDLGGIDFYRMQWKPDGTFSVVAPDSMHVVSMAWDKSIVAENDTAWLSIATVNRSGPVALEAVRLKSDGSEVPVALDTLELPAQVLPVADTTRVPWWSRCILDPGDPGPMRLVVRAADHTAAAGVISVTPQPALIVDRAAWNRDSVDYDQVATLSVKARNTVRRSLRLDPAILVDKLPAVPVDPASIRLAAAVPLAGRNTSYDWNARWLPTPGDPPGMQRPMRLQIRLPDVGMTLKTLVVKPPGPLSVTRLTWDVSKVAGDGSATLTIVAPHGGDRTATLQACRILGTGCAAVPTDTLGLPATVLLTGDTTRVPWAARWLPDPADTLAAMRLVVQVAETGTAAPELDVLRPEPLVLTAVAWDRDSVDQDSTARLTIVAQHWKRRWVTPRPRRVLAGGTQVAVAPDSLGLPGTIALAGDTTRLAWAARWLPAPPDTTSPLSLVLGFAESPLTAPPLAVRAPPFLVRAMWWDSATVHVGNGVALAIAAQNWQRRSVQLQASRMLAGGTLEPLSLDALGLPAELALTGDTTRLQWTAAIPDTGRLLQLCVHIADPEPRVAIVAVLGPDVPPAAVGAPAAPVDGLRARREGRTWALDVSLARAADVRLELFDVQGRRVRRLLARPLPAGITPVRWDGRGDDGLAASSGIYFARLLTPRARHGARVVWLR